MSLIKTFTVAEIEAHLESLNESMHLTSAKLNENCRSLINVLLNDIYAAPFSEPVDPEKLGLPDYFDIIKSPMDLGTIKTNVEKCLYTDLEDFYEDVRLVFSNAILYNGEKSSVGSMAKTLLGIFEKELKSNSKKAEKKGGSSMRDDEVCILCGVVKRNFEPIVLYCNGVCGMQRIRKNAAYYTDAKRENHYCNSCWSQVGENEMITLSDGRQVKKNSLQKVKNDAINEEGWACCDTCDGWVHQVCALFNGRKNKNTVSYKCPKCHLADRKASGSMKPTLNVKKAADLPRCKLSDDLESGVHAYLEKAYNILAEKEGVDVSEVERVAPFTIRVVSNQEKNHVVREEMLSRYKSKGFPSEFPVRTKCILLFQKIHGSDVLIFGMYVYEYGHNCPSPNRRRVYISYLDSVQYFQPRSYRTVIYQSIIVEYLRHVKRRGFHTAHIWSCPPSKGDDYIFYVHPETQKTPKADRLCNWYMTILERARREGIVMDVKNLHDEYFLDAGNNPSMLPYFEGDYWVGEVENIISDVKKSERERHKAYQEINGTGKLSGGKSVVVPGNKRGTRSNPGELVAQEPDKIMTKLGQAFVNMKANFIVAYLYSREFVEATEKGTKFTVADEKQAIGSYLEKRRVELKEEKIKKEREEKNSAKGRREAKGKKGLRAKQGKDKDKLGLLVRSRPADERELEEGSAGKDAAAEAEGVETDSNGLSEGNDESAGEGMATGNAKAENGKGKGKAAMGRKIDVKKDTGDAKQGNEERDKPGERNRKANDDKGKRDGTNKRTADEEKGDDNYEVVKEEKAAAGPGKNGVVGKVDGEEVNTEKRGKSKKVSTRRDKKHQGAKMPGTLCLLDGTESNPDDPLDFPMLKSPTYLANYPSFTKKDPKFDETLEDDDLITSDIFDSRQQFLNYCQKNSSQFDDLRRAKHTTMMVLFQLHNPNAARFLPECGACYNQITHGIRYKCHQCPDFNLCQDCYQPVITGLWAQRDARFSHDPSHRFSAISAEEEQKGADQRRKAILGHVSLLEHCTRCDKNQCKKTNCRKMKALLKHFTSCPSRTSGCGMCTKLLYIVDCHAKKCVLEEGACKVPFCAQAKEKYKRLRMQQRQMDDRRRAAQNSYYREESNND